MIDFFAKKKLLCETSSITSACQAYNRIKMMKDYHDAARHNINPSIIIILRCRNTQENFFHIKRKKMAKSLVVSDIISTFAARKQKITAKQYEKVSEQQRMVVAELEIEKSRGIQPCT